MHFLACASSGAGDEHHRVVGAIPYRMFGIVSGNHNHFEMNLSSGCHISG